MKCRIVYTNHSIKSRNHNPFEIHYQLQIDVLLIKHPFTHPTLFNCTCVGIFSHETYISSLECGNIRSCSFNWILGAIFLNQHRNAILAKLFEIQWEMNSLYFSLTRTWFNSNSVSFFFISRIWIAHLYNNLTIIKFKKDSYNGTFWNPKQVYYIYYFVYSKMLSPNNMNWILLEQIFNNHLKKCYFNTFNMKQKIKITFDENFSVELVWNLVTFTFFVM